MRPRAAALVALALLAGPASAHPPNAAGLSPALACYAKREAGEALPASCAEIVFHRATGRVVAVDQKGHHLSLEHEAIPGVNPAGRHDYHVEPAHLLAAVEVGDEVVFVVESSHGHVVEVYPLLK